MALPGMSVAMDLSGVNGSNALSKSLHLAKLVQLSLYLGLVRAPSARARPLLHSSAGATQYAFVLNPTSTTASIGHRGRRPLAPRVSKHPARDTHATTSVRARVDSDDDDFYVDRARVDPPPLDKIRRALDPDNTPPRRHQSRNTKSRAATDRGLDAAPETSGSINANSKGSSGKGGQGVNQDDPLVKAWRSAQALNPSRDEMPRQSWDWDTGSHGGTKPSATRRSSRNVSHHRRPHRGGSYYRDREERVRNGRGVGEGARRGRVKGRNVQHVGLYMGDDDIPWYIKEVQVSGRLLLRTRPL